MYIIAVVNAYGNPHTPMSVDSADGDLQAVQKAAEPIQLVIPLGSSLLVALKTQKWSVYPLT